MASSSPPQLPPLPLVGGNSAGHPLDALRLRMERGEHKYANAEVANIPSVPGSEAFGGILPPPPLGDGIYATPHPTANTPTSFSPPMSPVKRGRAREDTSELPSFLPLGNVTQKNPIPQTAARADRTAGEPPELRIRPRFQCSWLAEADAALAPRPRSRPAPPDIVPPSLFQDARAEQAPSEIPALPKMGHMTLGSQTAAKKNAFRKRSGWTAINARCA